MDWHQANHKQLSAVLTQLRDQLAVWAEPQPRGGSARPRVSLADAVAAAEQAMPAPSAIARLVEKFGLTPFERDLLLLCAGVELDPALARLCDALGGHPQPSFGLGFRIIEGAHWSALGPDSR